MRPTMPLFSAEASHLGDVDVLRLTGELDVATTGELHATFAELGDKNVTALVVDARDLRFIDSRGLHALIQCMERVLANGSFALVPSRPVRRILEITGLTDALRTVDSFEAAVTTVSEAAHQTDQHLL